MSFGPAPIEKEAQEYRKNFGNNVLPGYIDQSMGYINKGMGQLDGVNSQVQNYISGIGKDPNTNSMREFLSGILSGKNGAAGAGQAAMGQAYNAQAVNATGVTANVTDLGMRGNTFAQMFGSDLGGLALQQRNMQTVADKLSSTTENPFAVLTGQAKEDAAFQNSQGMAQLRSQLASQGLDSTSGTGAAALAALQFNTNKQVADAGRANAVQGAQFQQQGLGMAGGLYGQMAGLDLQRATTGAQLGLSGYQADISNAGRMDQAALQNAQILTNVNLANSGAQNAANLANAQAQTNVSMSNAAGQNQMSQFNAGAQNQWRLAALQGQLGLTGQEAQQHMAALSLLSNNAGQTMNMGSNMWGQAFTGQQNYMNSMNQAAQASAAGRGQMWGGLLQGTLGLLGAAVGGPMGAGIGTALGGMFGGNRGAGSMNVNPAHPSYQPAPYVPSAPFTGPRLNFGPGNDVVMPHFGVRY